MPWSLIAYQQLDICDLGHTFGLTVLCLTSVSTPALNSVVNFTASLAGQIDDRDNHPDQTTSASVTAENQDTQFHEADFSTKLLCRVFSVSKRTLTTELGGPPCRGINELAAIFDASSLFLASAPLNTALYYLSLRLGKPSPLFIFYRRSRLIYCFKILANPS